MLYNIFTKLKQRSFGYEFKIKSILCLEEEKLHDEYCSIFYKSLRFGDAKSEK